MTDCRDPKDNKFLSLVAAAKAEVLVSSDTDLQVLNPWCGIPVIKPAEFLELQQLPTGASFTIQEQGEVYRF